eukprot:1476576-Prymnesium_polylepis.1
MEVSDKDDVAVIVPSEEGVDVVVPKEEQGKTKVAAPLPGPDEDDSDFDDIDEDASIRQEIQQVKPSTNNSDPKLVAERSHVPDGQMGT